MIPVSDLNNMPDSALINIYRALNYWGWHPLLGEAPEGWEGMPNYRKPYMGECKTKADIIRPYMRVIKERVPWRELHF